MEESKDLQSIYKIFRTFIYLSLVIEFFEYAITPGMLTFWGGIVADIYGRMKLMDIYQDGHLLHSKIMTLLIICVTCIGTRNKKHLEFNAKRMVIYPLSFGLMLMFLSVWLFYCGSQSCFFSLPCSTWHRNGHPSQRRALYLASSATYPLPVFWRAVPIRAICCPMGHT